MITVASKSKAFEMANKFIISGITKDEFLSKRAGYSIYVPIICEIEKISHISDLGDRLECNFENGDTINIWID